MIELLTQNEESVWVAPSGIVWIENRYTKHDEWAGTRVGLMGGRIVESVLAVDQIAELMDAAREAGQ